MNVRFESSEFAGLFYLTKGDAMNFQCLMFSYVCGLYVVLSFAVHTVKRNNQIPRLQVYRGYDVE